MSWHRSSPESQNAEERIDEEKRWLLNSKMLKRKQKLENPSMYTSMETITQIVPVA
jgi:hypothetical protein